MPETGDRHQYMYCLLSHRQGGKYKQILNVFVGFFFFNYSGMDNAILKLFWIYYRNEQISQGSHCVRKRNKNIKEERYKSQARLLWKWKYWYKIMFSKIHIFPCTHVNTCLYMCMYVHTSLLYAYTRVYALVLYY